MKGTVGCTGDLRDCMRVTANYICSKVCGGGAHPCNGRGQKKRVKGDQKILKTPTRGWMGLIGLSKGRLVGVWVTEKCP
jgi:hypothetical protein